MGGLNSLPVSHLGRPIISKMDPKADNGHIIIFNLQFWGFFFFFFRNAYDQVGLEFTEARSLKLEHSQRVKEQSPNHWTAKIPNLKF